MEVTLHSGSLSTLLGFGLIPERRQCIWVVGYRSQSPCGSNKPQRALNMPLATPLIKNSGRICHKTASVMNEMYSWWRWSCRKIVVFMNYLSSLEHFSFTERIKLSHLMLFKSKFPLSCYPRAPNKGTETAIVTFFASIFLPSNRGHLHALRSESSDVISRENV